MTTTTAHGAGTAARSTSTTARPQLRRPEDSPTHPSQVSERTIRKRIVELVLVGCLGVGSILAAVRFLIPDPWLDRRLVFHSSARVVVRLLLLLAFGLWWFKLFRSLRM